MTGVIFMDTARACSRCAGSICWIFGFKSICCRTKRSKPTRWLNAKMNPRLSTVMIAKGGHHRGWVEISWKAALGSNRTPERRPSSLMGCGCAVVGLDIWSAIVYLARAGVSPRRRNLVPAVLAVARWLVPDCQMRRLDPLMTLDARSEAAL